VNQTFGIETLRDDSGLGNKVAMGVYLVPVHANSTALDLREGNPANGTPFQIWQQMEHNPNQLFKITPIDNSDAFLIQIKPGTLKCLGVSEASMSDGAPTELQDCSNGDGQAWYFVPVAREGGRFMILNKRSGKSLDVLGIGTANGTRVGQWEFVNGNNQKWELRDWR